jgi:hypothetical protein
MRDFTIRESFDEAAHSIQTTPFCLAVSLLNVDATPVTLESLDGSEVAPSIGLAGILRAHCMLTGARVHLPLIRIALALLLPVMSGLHVALAYLPIVPTRCNCACVFSSQKHIQTTIW